MAIAAAMMQTASPVTDSCAENGGANNAPTASFAPPYNSVVLIDRHGKIVYDYRKVHTCDWVYVESMTR
jgi:predicted amidohydrolase